MPRAPRMSIVDDADATEAQLQVLDRLRRPDGSVINIFRTVVNHPDLARRWLVFGTHVMAKSTLSDRVRELLILRIGWLCGSEYEWSQHVVIARDAGITDDEIERIKVGADAAEWSAADRVVLSAADELHHDRDISDDTWNELSKHFSEQQRMDLVFTVGQYNLVSMALRSFGVPLDDGLVGFGS